jgi:hypothetical protein
MILDSLTTADNLVVLYSRHTLNLLRVLLGLLRLLVLWQELVQVVHNVRELLHLSLASL